MRERYIPALIMLIAAAITGIINIINQVEKLTALKRLLAVILVFYIIGLIIRAIVTKVLIQGPKVDGMENEETGEEGLLDEPIEE